MSYDIYLTDPITKAVLETGVPHLMRGGTYSLSGTNEMWLNITYNYARWYYKDYAFGKDGIRTIYGMSGADSVPILEKAISGLLNTKEGLSDEEILNYEKKGVSGYWLPSKENALRPLYELLSLAKLRPDGIWDGD